MRYLILVVAIIAAWFVVDEFLIRDRTSEGLRSYREKLKDLGGRLHYVFGILAILIFLIMLLRLILGAFVSH